MNFNEKHNFKSGTVELLKRDVMLISYDKGSKIGVEDAEEVRDIRNKLIGQNNFYNIMNLSKGLLKITSEAKAWMAVHQKSGAVRVADFIVVKSFYDRLRVLSYLFFFKPQVKTYTVSSVKKAEDLIAKLKVKAVKKKLGASVKIA